MIFIGKYADLHTLNFHNLAFLASSSLNIHIISKNFPSVTFTTNNWSVCSGLYICILSLICHIWDACWISSSISKQQRFLLIFCFCGCGQTHMEMDFQWCRWWAKIALVRRKIHFHWILCHLMMPREVTAGRCSSTLWMGAQPRDCLIKNHEDAPGHGLRNCHRFSWK